MQTPETSSILVQLGEKTRRQVELTLCALARSIRKAIRQAEQLDRAPGTTPAQRESAWALVNQRNETLCQFMAALAPAPAPVAEPAPIAEEEEAVAATIEPLPQPLDIVDELEMEIKRLVQLPRGTVHHHEKVKRAKQALCERIRQQAPEYHRVRLLERLGVY